MRFINPRHCSSFRTPCSNVASVQAGSVIRTRRAGNAKKSANRSSDAPRSRPRKSPRVVCTSRASVAGVLGFEPRQTDPESAVLPLHHTPVGPSESYRPHGRYATRKSRRFQPEIQARCPQATTIPTPMPTIRSAPAFGRPSRHGRVCPFPFEQRLARSSSLRPLVRRSPPGTRQYLPLHSDAPGTSRTWRSPLRSAHSPSPACGCPKYSDCTRTSACRSLSAGSTAAPKS
jgi:hypothetical protein